MSAIGGHHSANAGTDVWLTPPHILEDLGPFDLDPCAAPDPKPWPTARRHVTLPEDGLSAPWRGRIWCNPPYGKEAGRWLARMAEHRHGTALVFARTETSWFFPTVWNGADALLFLEGRLHFHYPDGRRADANAGGPSVLVAYGHYDAERLESSTLPGKFIRLRAPVVFDLDPDLEALI